MPAADYNTRFTNHINGQPGYVQAAIDPAVDQHATGNVAATFRTFAQWRTAFQAAQGWTDAQMTAWLAGAGSNINTASKYHSFCGGWATTIVKEVCDAYLSPNQGVNLLHFQGLHNRESAPGGRRLNGFATSFPSTGRNKCAFVLCAAATNYGGNSNTPEQTVTHEIGHCMFLAHAPQNVTATDIANQPDATVHDDDWTNCAMGYRYDQERKFCGFCLLRLRGWDRAQLKPTAADNRKR
jgi:hypothetical protein